MINAGEVLGAAVDEVLSNPATRTAELGGAIGTKVFGVLVADIFK